MKNYIFILFLFFSFGTHAQVVDGMYTKATWDYHKFRNKTTIPPYGLDKVKSYIKKISIKNQDSDEELIALSDKDFNALSLREKFTYIMINAEVNFQNCDIDLPIVNEEKYLLPYPGHPFDGGNWSEKQINFLKKNRDSVMSMIKESSTRSKHMGSNYKMALYEINAIELIPFIISFYNMDKKDGDLLTLLMLLMKENKYPEFINSISYKKLYSYESVYDASIDYNTANQNLIIKRALDFYNQYKK